MNLLIDALTRLGILKDDLDQHFLRASMVIIFFFLTYFLGAAEWLFGALIFLGFWRKKLGFLGDLGSCFSFVATFTIIPFLFRIAGRRMPEGFPL